MRLGWGASLGMDLGRVLMVCVEGWWGWEALVLVVGTGVRAGPDVSGWGASVGLRLGGVLLVGCLRVGCFDWDERKSLREVEHVVRGCVFWLLALIVDSLF